MEPLELEPDEPSEPSEPGFGVYIGTKKLDFGLEDLKKYFETSYGGSFSRGFRWC